MLELGEGVAGNIIFRYATHEPKVILQYCNESVLSPGRVFALFRDLYVETLNFSPKGAGMDPHLGGGGLSVPMIFSQGLIDITFFNFPKGEGISLCSACRYGLRGPEFFPQVVREVLNTDQAIFADNGGIFDDIFQFTYVTRKFVGHQHREDLRQDPVDLLSIQAIELAYEIIHEKGDIFSAFSQGGEHESDHIDPVIKILPERPLLDQIREVLVGSRHDTDIRLMGRDAPERLVDPVLKHTKQPYL